MARFYAKFDSGSSGWVSTLDNLSASGSFDRRSIAANSASAALLRDGLIASRSLLSADIYADLDSTNRDGSKGTYFPPDSGSGKPFSTDGSTFVSWSTAYSSSVDGIKTPVVNEYGVLDSINYSKRPTASILSTATTLVGPTTPADPVGASYTTYINAANAVTAVLNAIQQGGGPTARLGNYPSRTLHSLWHNPTLDYFAWDDFTPGAPQSYTVTSPSPSNGLYWYTDPFSYTLDWSSNYQYASDALALPYVYTMFHETGSTTPIQTNSGGGLISAGAVQFIFTITADPLSAGGSGEYELDTIVRFRDAKLSGKGLVSDGIEATTINANTITLTRLFLYSGLTYRSTWSGTCSDYTGGTYYATVTTGTSLAGKMVYTSTNTASPTQDINAYYAYNGTVYQKDGDSIIIATEGGCSGGTTSTTTAGTTTTTSTTTIGT